jgi:hypothetical protein
MASASQNSGAKAPVPSFARSLLLRPILKISKERFCVFCNNNN